MSKYSLDNLLLVLVVEMIAEQQKKKNAVVPSDSHNVELKHGVLK